jgi:serine/threonine protein kinase
MTKPSLASLFVLLSTASFTVLATPTFSPDRVGLYSLPKISSHALPAVCGNFSEACAAEAAEKYELAMQLYEERYEQCGDHGWNITGRSSGSNEVVTFKTTPCGLRVAIKAAHTPKECSVLRFLSSRTVQQECPGCFPRYYFLSNFTHACYSEAVQKAEIRGFRGKYANLQHVKAFYLQALKMVSVLRKYNIEHRDLSFRNILLRNMTRADGRIHQQIVFIDFGSARPLDALKYLEGRDPNLPTNSKGHPFKFTFPDLDADGNVIKGTGSPPVPRRLDGNYGYNDIYAVTCTFYMRSYSEYGANCINTGPPKHPPGNDTESLLYVYASILHKHADRSVELDHKWVRQQLYAVQRF